MWTGEKRWWSLLAGALALLACGLLALSGAALAGHKGDPHGKPGGGGDGGAGGGAIYFLQFPQYYSDSFLAHPAEAYVFVTRLIIGISKRMKMAFR